MNGKLTLGVDLGQVSDPTAYVLIEETMHQPEGIGSDLPDLERHYTVRGIRTLSLGTPYDDVIVDLMQWIGAVVDQSGRMPTVVMDTSGVGLPVFDLIRKRTKGIPVRGVTMTSGADVERKGFKYVVGKERLAQTMSAHFTARAFHQGIAHDLAPDLLAELRSFSYRTGARSTKFGAKPGRHDDLVMAAAIALWYSSDTVDSFDTFMTLMRRGRGGCSSVTDP